MISVIIPLYNKKATIRRTIDSILGQTHKDFEIIIVDDGSTDGSLSVIPRLMRDPAAKDKIKLFSESGHHGAGWARNYGAHFAKGEYFFFCDADIILRPDALMKFKKALDENTKASYAYSAFQLGWKIFKSRSFDGKALRARNFISTMSLIKRDDFPGFDEKLKKFQDWDIYLVMLERGKTGIFIPKVLFYAKPSRSGISKWFPRFFYKIPWQKFGIKMQSLEKYNEALREIKIKHNL